MSEQARQKASSTTKELKQKRTELAEWYGGLKHGSKNAWEEIKAGFSQAYTEMKKAWENADNQKSP
jgi:hypothetical protein